MFEKTKKKLIHFDTSGNIEKDFLASKKKKSAGLRALIRLCFFFHLIGCIACAILGYVFDTDRFMQVAVCAGIDIVIAFFAAGGEMTTKASLVVIDIILAAAGAVNGFSSSENERFLYLLFSSAAICGAVLAVAEMIAAYLRDYLQDFPFEKLKKDDFNFVGKRTAGRTAGKTAERSVGKGSERSAVSSETGAAVAQSMGENAKMPIMTAPKISEMRELAKKLNAVLNGVPEEHSIIKDEIDISEIRNQRN